MNWFWQRASVTRMTAAAFAAFLSACANNTEFQRPEIPPVALRDFSSASNLQNNASPPAHWWVLYHDEDLNKLIEEALRRNYDLKVAAANLRQYQAFLERAGADSLPSVSESIGLTYGRDETTDGLAYAGGITPPNRLSEVASIGLSYQLDIFGGVRSEIDAAKADIATANAQVLAAQVAVAAAVTRAYLQACSSGEQLKAAKSSVDVAQRAYEITKMERAAGHASEFDVERSEAILENARSSIAPLNGARTNATFEIAYLQGKPPAEIPPRLLKCEKAPVLVSPLPVGDGAALLSRRPDVRIAESKVTAEYARLGIAKANLYPSIRFGMAGGYEGNNAIRGSTAVSLGIGPLISWNFPNRIAAKAQVKSSQASLQKAIAEFDQTVLRSLKEVEQALTLYAADVQSQEALEAAVQHSQKAYYLVQARLRAGASSRLDTIVAEQTLLSAIEAKAAQQSRLEEDQALVFIALGGGWE